MGTRVSADAMELARKISATEKADIYLYNGPINESGFGAVVTNVNYKNRKAILILTTYGGSANSGYRIARFFQTMYRTFTVAVFSYCKSAGTLVALGANQFMMGEVAELGPLDVQLYKRDELWERRSGLVLRNAITSLNERAESLFSHLMLQIRSRSQALVRFKLASELAAQMTVGMFAHVYGQISPEALGEDYQETMVAHEYGKRLAGVSRVISDASIAKLVNEYPSHDFVIDKLEARSLFYRVDDPSEDLYQLAIKLGELVFIPDSEQVTVENLSKVDESEKKDETNEKSASNEEPQATAGGSSGSDPASA